MSSSATRPAPTREKRGRDWTSSRSSNSASSSANPFLRAHEAAEAAAEAAEAAAEKQLQERYDNAQRAVTAAKDKQALLTQQLKDVKAELATAEKEFKEVVRLRTGVDIDWGHGSKGKKTGFNIAALKIGAPKPRAPPRQKPTGMDLDVEANGRRRSARPAAAAAAPAAEKSKKARRNVKAKKATPNMEVTTVGQLKNMLIQLIMKTHPDMKKNTKEVVEKLREELRTTLHDQASNNEHHLSAPEIVASVKHVSSHFQLPIGEVHVTSLKRDDVEAAIRSALAGLGGRRLRR